MKSFLTGIYILITISVGFIAFCMAMGTKRPAGHKVFRYTKIEEAIEAKNAITRKRNALWRELQIKHGIIPTGIKQ